MTGYVGLADSAEKFLTGSISFYDTCDTIGDGLLLYPGSKKQDILDHCKKFAARPSHVFITSYLRSGTNWISYIVQLIRNDGAVPEVDLDHFAVSIDEMTQEEVEAIEFPRIIKWHFPYDHVAGGPPHQSPAKYIYSYRNPRDVAVSLFLLNKGLEKVRPIVWSEFLDDFISGNVTYGSQLHHIKSWWEHRDSPNILMLSYERMKKDPVGAVQSISTFLGYQLSQKLIEEIAANSRINKMKKNLESFNSALTKYKYVRKGVVGEWHNYFGPEDIKKLDAAVKEKLGDTDIVFDYGDTIDQ
uniref:Sulfotransferase domain-containing protein n=1 Tax=Amphimedon queenslandica TaxID=400682 RepID=A0A1X7TID1_AMPQE